MWTNHTSRVMRANTFRRRVRVHVRVRWDVLHGLENWGWVCCSFGWGVVYKGGAELSSAQLAAFADSRIETWSWTES
jgi:hypothetical protein